MYAINIHFSKLFVRTKKYSLIFASIIYYSKYDTFDTDHFLSIKRGTCIKGLFWPPLEPKTESCFSPISSYWFIRRIAQV